MREKLSSYDLILSGHMHNGCIPPIIDELVKNNRGIIAPNKKIFPKNARGISIVGNYAVVSSGITKLSRSAPLILRMFNFIFPMSIHELIIGSDDVYKNNIKYLKWYWQIFINNLLLECTNDKFVHTLTVLCESVFNQNPLKGALPPESPTFLLKIQLHVSFLLYV